ncbi:nitrite reductase (NAD(P)H) small subunit [Solwaraspora sp. WMMB335]|uniref:nitrite reductase (NAD(P)H) small subunit n=1 Tax=Solwaraspora sp. WMMB335 TaxID=3404118 RepID=UPI003B963DA9
MSVQTTDVTGQWTPVCPDARVEPEHGMTGTHVMSRGIVGARGDVPTVASPLHKQVYGLRTGQCLDLPDVTVQDR